METARLEKADLSARSSLIREIKEQLVGRFETGIFGGFTRHVVVLRTIFPRDRGIGLR